MNMVVGFRKCFIAFCTLMLFHLTLYGVAPAQNLIISPAKKNSHPKMSSRLWKLEKEYEAGIVAPWMLAQGMDTGLHDPDNVIVYLMSEPDRDMDEDSLYDLGAKIIKQSGNVTKAMVPVNMLTAVADTVEGVSFIKTPDKLIPVAVTSEGVNLTKANSYHNEGYDGSGVRIAVIDVGFAGLTSAIDAGELPSSTEKLKKIDCTGTSCESRSFSAETDPHGTAVAEIVYDMAPGAMLYLIKVSDILDLKYAEDYIVNINNGITNVKNQIRIINHSLVVPNTNFYDGECWSISGIPNAVCTANDAYVNNILWVNAVGNEAQRHYEGDFDDSDVPVNGWHNVSVGNEKIYLKNPNTGSNFINAGDTIEVYLTWDAWSVVNNTLTTDQDYDLYLYLYNSSGSDTEVDRSVDQQAGNPLQTPTEKIVYDVPSNGTYYLKIRKYNATSNHALELYSINHNLTPTVASSSLLSPADALGAMAVGAINYSDWTTGPQAPYSSQGPTNDGRIKPDIMGPDHVSNSIYGRFTGTSASSPHVAGAAALILNRFPGMSVDDLWYFMTSTAVDMGIRDKDNIYGYGRLKLDINAAIPTNITVAGSDGGGGGCFIATAAYGSYTAPYVKILREMRDRFLLKSRIGKRFVNLYYKYSPPLADIISKHDSLKVVVRLGLLPLVGISWLMLKLGPVWTITFMLLFALGLIRFLSYKKFSKRISK